MGTLLFNPGLQHLYDGEACYPLLTSLHHLQKYTYIHIYLHRHSYT